MLEHKEDFYIPFAETNHNNPYDNPTLHKVEDILGYKMTFYPSLNDGDKRYLKARRKELKEDICNSCVRLENEGISNHFLKSFGDASANVLQCNGCRVFKVKQSLTRVTKSWPKLATGYNDISDQYMTRWEHFKAIFRR